MLYLSHQIADNQKTMFSIFTKFSKLFSIFTKLAKGDSENTISGFTKKELAPVLDRRRNLNQSFDYFDIGKKNYTIKLGGSGIVVNRQSKNIIHAWGDDFSDEQLSLAYELIEYHEQDLKLLKLIEGKKKVS